MSELAQQEGNFVLSFDEEISNNNLVMTFFPHQKFQMTMSFKDDNQDCAALLEWTSRSGKMGDFEIPNPCKQVPSYYMLQFNLFPSTTSMVRIFCENTPNFFFPLTLAGICGSGLAVKKLVDIKFSPEYKDLRYRASALKYNNNNLPG